MADPFQKIRLCMPTCFAVLVPTALAMATLEEGPPMHSCMFTGGPQSGASVNCVLVTAMASAAC